MASKTTGKAASVARRAATKKKQIALKQQQSDASTSSLTTNRVGTGGSARGDDFASDFSGSESGTKTRNTPVDTTPRTKSQLQRATFSLAGVSEGRSTSAAQARETAARIASQQRKQRSERRQQLNKNNRLASDNLRASQTDTTLGESTTAKGARSTRGLTDAEIDDLARRGFREGDFVPGRGVLLPDGTFDTKKLDQLKAIETELQTRQQQAEALRQQESSAASNAVATDAPEVKEEESATTSIADAIKENPMSKTMAVLDEQIRLIRDSLREEERSIKADSQRSKEDTRAAQASETGQTSLALAQAGGYLGTSGSAQGVMLRLAESHRAEINKLDIERQKAIAEARRAAANREFDVVREKARIVQQIEKEAYDREIEYQEKVQEAEEEQAIEAEALAQENTIFTALQGGAKTPTDIFKTLEGKVSIEAIDKFLSKAQPARKDGDAFAYSKSDVAQFLGAGLGQDDIAALNETVNELGYTDEVRSALPAAVRAVADKVYRQKTSGDGSVGTIINGRKISSTTLQVLDGFTKMSQLTSTMQQKVRDDLYVMGFADNTAPAWFTEADYPDGVATESFSGLSFPGLDAVTNRTPQKTAVASKQVRNEQWKKYVRNILDDENEGDSELDEIDEIRTQIQERTRQ